MRVVVTNPPWKVDGDRGIRSGCRMPNTIGDGEHTFIPFPYTVAYATSRLEADGVETLMIDGIAEDLEPEAFRSRIAGFGPDLVVIEMATQSHDVDMEWARRLKESTGARIAMAGSHPTALPDEVLASEFIDFVLHGEYEQTVSELVARLAQGASPEGIEGLGWRRPDGTVVAGARRSLLSDLDELPWPHRASLPLENYRIAGLPWPVLYMYASRGCPYLCNFCVWPQWFGAGSYRVRTPKDVVDEIEHAQREWGPFRSIFFDDDTFNIGNSRMKEMAGEFVRRGLDTPWGCNARTDRFTDEMMKRLADAGLVTVRIGVESGDPRVLERVKKGLDLETVQRCIDMAHKYGVRCHVTFTVGLSGESWESIEKTVRFAKSITPDSIAFTITAPFPGTSYWEEAVRNGHLTTRDWREFNVVSKSVVRTETMTPEDIVRAEKYVMRKVYYSPKYIFRRLRYVGSGTELAALGKKAVKFAMGKF